MNDTEDRAYTFTAQLLQLPWQRLSHISRFSSLPVLKTENVAEHSFYVAFYAMLFGDILEKEYGCRVNFARLLRRAISHDLDEALSGDFIRPFKYFSPRLHRALDAASDLGMRRASLATPCSSAELHDDWARAKDRKTLEGRILQATDLFCVYVYARRELLQGNLYMRRVLDEVLQWLGTWLSSFEAKDKDFWGRLLLGLHLAYDAVSEPRGAALAAAREMQDPFLSHAVKMEDGDPLEEEQYKRIERLTSELDALQNWRDYVLRCVDEDGQYKP